MIHRNFFYYACLLALLFPSKATAVPTTLHPTSTATLTAAPTDTAAVPHYYDKTNLRRRLQGGGGGGGYSGGGGGGYSGGGYNDYSSYDSDSSGEEGCYLSEPECRAALWRFVKIILISFATFCGCNAFSNIVAYIRMKVYRETSQRWVRAAGEDTSETPRLIFPSGEWKGYYRQYEQRHQLFSFQVSAVSRKDNTHKETQQFIVEEIVPLQGSGEDNVGQYTIEGHFNTRLGQLVWAKRYQVNTGDRHENLGHLVVYRGTAIDTKSLQAGIRGSWFVATHKYTGSGMFHIWPCCTSTEQTGYSSIPSCCEEAGNNTRDDPNNNDDSFHPPLHEKPSFEPCTSFREVECVVCLGASVNVGLMPCGHVALCQTCALSLDTCPLCRTHIESFHNVATGEVWDKPFSAL